MTITEGHIVYKNLWFVIRIGPHPNDLSLPGAMPFLHDRNKENEEMEYGNLGLRDRRPYQNDLH